MKLISILRVLLHFWSVQAIPLGRSKDPANGGVLALVKNSKFEAAAGLPRKAIKQRKHSNPLGSLATYALSGERAMLPVSPSPAMASSRSSTFNSPSAHGATSTATMSQSTVMPVEKTAAEGDIYTTSATGQLLTLLSFSGYKPAPSLKMTNLRIEGPNHTIFEGTVFSGPGIVTTPSAGPHLCDGTNNGANPNPTNTATNALAAAAAASSFPFDGTFYTQFDDFYITSIGNVTETKSEFWGLLSNFHFTPKGGCQTEVGPTDDVLWAYDAFNKAHFLKLSLSSTTAPAGQAITASVTDGSTGAPIQNALIRSVLTGTNGQVALTFPQPGSYWLKASRSDSIRSNGVLLNVT